MIEQIDLSYSDLSIYIMVGALVLNALAVSLGLAVKFLYEKYIANE